MKCINIKCKCYLRNEKFAKLIKTKYYRIQLRLNQTLTEKQTRDFHCDPYDQMFVSWRLMEIERGVLARRQKATNMVILTGDSCDSCDSYRVVLKLG